MADIVTSVGRIVWGHPTRGQQKKDDNNNVVLKDGQPVIQWVFGVAFPRVQFEQEVWPVMSAEAMKLFPNGVPGDFSWKYKDGDNGVDKNNQPLRNKEGFAGCIILTVSTEANAPTVVKFNPQSGRYDQVDENGIKTGDYVSLGLNIVGHVGQGRKKSGLYINPRLIEHVGYGQAIYNGPDPMAMFGGRQHQLPQGASATPISPQPNMQPAGMVGNSGGGMMQPAGMAGNSGGGMMQQQQPMQQQPMQQQPMQQQQPVYQAQPQQQGGYGQQPMQQQPVYQPQQQAPQMQPAYDYVTQTTGQPYPQQQQPMQQGGMMQQQPQQMGNAPGQMPMGGLPGQR